MTLDDRLRAALPPVDPGADFAARTLARLANDASPPATHLARWRPPVPATALAASLLVAGVAGVLLHQHRGRDRGEQAAHQLALALELTGRELQNLHQYVAPTGAAPPQEQDP